MNRPIPKKTKPRFTRIDTRGRESLETLIVVRHGLSSFQENSNIKTGQGFPGDTVVKNLPANARDTGSCPGPGRSHMLRSN